MNPLEISTSFYFFLAALFFVIDIFFPSLGILSLVAVYFLWQGLSLQGLISIIAPPDLGPFGLLIFLFVLAIFFRHFLTKKFIRSKKNLQLINFHLKGQEGQIVAIKSDKDSPLYYCRVEGELWMAQPSKQLKAHSHPNDSTIVLEIGDSILVEDIKGPILIVQKIGPKKEI